MRSLGGVLLVLALCIFAVHATESQKVVRTSRKHFLSHQLQLTPKVNLPLASSSGEDQHGAVSSSEGIGHGSESGEKNPINPFEAPPQDKSHAPADKGHTAGSEAAHGHGDAHSGHGHAHHPPDEVRRHHAIALFVIFTYLVIIVVGFETLSHYILHHAPDGTKDIIGSLMEELTVFGFTAVTVQLLLRAGVLETFGDMVMPDEHHGHAFVQLLEKADVMLFGMMVVFCLYMLHFIKVSMKTLQSWEKFDDKVRILDKKKVNQEERAQIVQLLSEDEELNFYYAMRERFVNPAHSSPSSQLLPKRDQFSFPKYLHYNMKHSLSRLIHLSPGTWFIMYALLMAAAAVVFLPDALAISLLVLSGLLNVLFLWVVKWKLDSIKQNMVTLVETNADDQESPIASVKGPPVDYPSARENFQPSEGYFGNVIIPQHQLFWAGDNGPVFILSFLRILMLGNAIYVSAWISIIMWSMCASYGVNERTISLLGLAAVFPLINLYLFPLVMKTFAEVSFIEGNRSAPATDAIIFEIKDGKATRALKVLAKVQEAGGKMAAVTEEDLQKMDIDTRQEVASKKQATEVAFRQILENPLNDAQKNGKWINKNQFKYLLKSIGFHEMSEESFEELWAAADEDGNGELCESEAKNIVGSMAAGSEHIIRRIFDKIDTSGDGEIDMQEFSVMLTELDCGLSDREMEDLFFETDTSGDGQICFDEFADLLMTHSTGIQIVDNHHTPAASRSTIANRDKRRQTAMQVVTQQEAQALAKQAANAVDDSAK
jgi:Ca2+-binding EF-hand superfamily protein